MWGLREVASGSQQPVPRLTAPQSYTPKHLAEKILTSKSALEGERKQAGASRSRGESAALKDAALPCL